MAHMVETMAYAGELPWHGLGVKVIDDLTPEQMMQKAGVDWSVEKQDLVTKMGSSVKNKQALVRSSDGEVLDIVGKGWNPVQNAEAFNFFEEYVRAGDMQMHTAGSLNGGKMVWALAKTNESFELFNGDVTENYFLFSNPHEFGKAIDIRMTPIRVVCNNTLTLSLSQDSNAMLKVNHRKAFDLGGPLRANVEQIQVFQPTEGISNRLARYAKSGGDICLGNFIARAQPKRFDFLVQIIEDFIHCGAPIP